MGRLGTAALAAADEKGSKLGELNIVNDVLCYIRDKQITPTQEKVIRRMERAIELIRKDIIDEYNDLHNKTYKQEEGPNESIDLCSRSGNRHDPDDGKPVQHPQGG